MVIAARPHAPRLEHRTGSGTVLALGSTAPRLSWSVPSADEGYEQTAAEVEIRRATGTSAHLLEGPEQVLVAWPAAPLHSREEVAVRVRVAHGSDWSPWSEPTLAEAGLLDPADWTARFVTPVSIGGDSDPAPLLSGRIDIAGRVVKARLYASAHGVYEARINGRLVSEDALAPGWTSYDHRLRYHAYDVTALVTGGENTLDAVLGNGWYRGRLGWEDRRAVYGDRLALLAQLEITTDDGAVHVLATDPDWTARPSGVLADDLYDGQTTDLRHEDSAQTLTAVETVAVDLGTLVAPQGPSVRQLAVLDARRIWESPTGSLLVDFGQNAVGRLRLRVRGLEEGARVVLKHAEALEDGGLATRALRSAQATDVFVVRGDAEELLEPTLTLHGFRYAEITGVPDLQPEDVELVVLGTDLRRTGWFDSSHALLNRFHENVVWSLRGNFVDVPTDCPQRDERLGWTGDIQVFAPTAAFLFDVNGFLDSWLADLAAEQLPDGSLPHVVPDVIRSELMSTPAAAWGDAATVVPWVLHQRTGDLEVLRRQYPSMRAWVEAVLLRAGADRLWTGGFQYGDWLDPTAPPEDPYRAKADPDVVATAHLARSTSILAATARLLGLDDDARAYTSIAAEVRAAFADAYVTPAGRVLSDAQTVYALALQWALLPGDDQRRLAGERLADLVRASGFRISTGFVGTPLICDALTDAGQPELAHRLLLQTGLPSWLYPVTMDATTIWERWDSMLPDGTVNPGEMTSFNHYALGAVADWMHRSVAGLAPAAPGYRRLEVRPLPPAELEHAHARHLTPYGEASVSWRRAGGRLVVEATVPVGVTATVHLPDGSSSFEVGHGRHCWDVADPDRRTGAPAVIRDVLDDEATWRAVVDRAVREGVVDGERTAATRLAAYLDAPVTELARALVPDNTDVSALRGDLLSTVAGGRA